MNNKLVLVINLKKYKKNNEYSFKKYVYGFFIKIFIVIIIFLGALIYIKQDNKNKNFIKNVVYKNNVSFARIYNLYKKYINFNIFTNIVDKDVKVASNTINYKNVIKDNNGYVFSIKNNYFSAIKSGILIRKKKTNKYNYLITIQDKDGLEITYGYLSDVKVKLYDYVKKDEILGTTNKKVYLRFKKDNKFLSYEEYI